MEKKDYGYTPVCQQMPNSSPEKFEELLLQTQVRNEKGTKKDTGFP